MRRVPTRVVALVLSLLAATALSAQQSTPSTGPAVPRLVRVTGTFVPATHMPAAPVETVTLAIYAEESGGVPLWQETQYVTVDADGRYALLLGASLPDGLPLDLFASGEARWLGRHFERPGEREQARVLLASVPYALKASDADTLGGRPPSAYLLADPRASGDGHATTTDATSATGTSKTASASGVQALTAGNANYIARFTNATDLGNSAIYDAGGSVGINTTTPFDALHVRFTNTTGAFTGYAVQNLSSGAASYSGMLFYDQNGALGQFQGFNNSTHEYRINNIATNGSINFMLGGVSKFAINAAGNIGIDTTSTPTAKFTVNASGYGIVQTNGTVDVGSYLTSFGGWFGTRSNHPLYFFTNDSSPRMTIDTAGNVGIGTLTPTHARVEIGGFSGSWSGGPGYQLDSFSGVSQFFSAIISGPSLYATSHIVAADFFAFSDARTKRIEGRSNAVRDLAALAGIEVTDYSYIDTLTKGTGLHKKVIAQQVEQVYPQAVSRSTDVVPDIYQKAQIRDSWVRLATTLKPGERVRLIGEATEGIYEVLEVADGKFRTAFAGDGDEVFVFGREVNDFRSVDYEAIAMLNVSATQELNRRVAEQTEQMQKQTARITELEQERQVQTTRLAGLEQQATEIARLRQQLDALEAAVQTAGLRESTRVVAPYGKTASLRARP
jgi:hypothetical protein